jgi:hypothetical protein
MLDENRTAETHSGDPARRKAESDMCVTGEDMGQMEPEVKIAPPMSHNTLTSVEEYVQ